MSEHAAAPTLPDLAAIRAAQVRIAPYVHRTPVLTCRSLDALVGARLYFKCESLQKVGAFKARGACNAVFGLPEDVAARGVVTHSSGNHGAALAYAAQRRGIPAHVVMPEDAPKIKIANVEGFGAHVHFCAPTLVARVETCAAVARTTGATLVHPYDDVAVIAGQGTAALELIEAVPDLDVIVAPVGGGGLLAGTAIAARGVRPDIAVMGAEPAGADDTARSLAAGARCVEFVPDTVCDGLRGALGAPNFTLLRACGAEVVTIQDSATVAAMQLAWQVLKQVIEPSSAIALAAVLAQPQRFAGRRVGVILSGGNVDLEALPWQR